jgi:4-alpha-glucanotransferase
MYHQASFIGKIRHIWRERRQMMPTNGEITHNSQAVYYRCPVGAVEGGSIIQLGLKIGFNERVSSVIVRLWQENFGEKLIVLKPEDTEKGLIGKKVQGAFYSAKIKIPEKGCLLWYYFIISTSVRTLYYGNNPQHLGGVGQCYDGVPPSFQITVYNKGAKTPDWFKHSIMYQIFPDRFNRKGDKLIPKKGAVIHTDWNDLPFYYKDVDTKEIVAYDFFGGNLAGIQEKLSYLKELGISVIYLNPIFESPSNHHYDTGDYHKIDPILGTNEDFIELCSEAKKAGIRIILDGVFSHTGSDSRYFNREGNYDSVGAFQSMKSQYYEWYSFHKYPYEYDSWWGFYTLPNVKETTASYLDFIINNDKSVLKYWMGAGISGWRLDVIDELPALFSQRFYKVLKEENPEAVLIGEVWEDASNKVAYGMPREYLCGQEMDSAMNYPFRQILLDFLLGNTDAKFIDERMQSLKENYPKENFYAMMNLIGSHDVQRILTLLGEAPFYEGMPAIQQARYRLDDDHFNLGVARVKMAVLWQMTFPGVPCVYYGDEIGMQGFKDPYNRGAYKWNDGDEYLYKWYKKVIAMRNTHEVLQTGEFITLLANGAVYAYARVIRGGKDVFGKAATDDLFITIFNRSRKEEINVVIEVGDLCCGELREVFGAAADVEIVRGKMNVVVSPLQGLLFERKKEVEKLPRMAGILLHPTSLPSKYGMGDFGTEAYKFIDFLVAAGQKLWQILPLNPVGYGYSPYQSPSAFAGNPMMIALDKLMDEGLLQKKDLKLPFVDTRSTVDFEHAWMAKKKYLQRAYQNFLLTKETDDNFASFCEEQSEWLEDYALYEALKKEYKGLSWTEWPEEIKKRNTASLAKERQHMRLEIDYEKFLQYKFFQQWKELHSYAKENGVQIIGDMPIFIAQDSVDVWANQEFFKLDENGKPLSVAGVPPDYFSKTGQLWGNPHYRWDKMKEDDYAWWRKRVEKLLQAVDIIRIDHFRGFESYWEIPGDAKTAVDGEWVKGPGTHFFKTLEEHLGKLPIIAEDLGIITDEVEELRQACGFPGMKVLHFELYFNEMQRLGLACPQNSIIYTGTHDNNTTAGWFREDTDHRTQAGIAALLGADREEPQDVCKKLIDFAYASGARAAIIPMQDVLGLDSQARMNMPGTVGTNWKWCAKNSDFTVERAAELKELCERYKR